LYSNLSTLSSNSLWFQECQENADTIADEELDEQLFPLKEYRLHGRPQSLKENSSTSACWRIDGDDSNCAIWIPESDAFVCIVPGWTEGRFPGAYCEGVFEVELSSDKHLCDNLSVFSSTVEQAIPCLEFLFGLHDSHFQKLSLSYKVDPLDAAGEPLICSLTNRCLEKLLIQNENRENTFSRMAFTPEQSRVLAGSGTNIELSDCRFPDGGVAFVDEARQHSSLTKLCLWCHLLFDDRNFGSCLDYLNLEYLGLHFITFDDEHTCRAVAVAEINYLCLDHCKFEDQEAVQVLVDNIRAERGPKCLSLTRGPFKSPERLGELMNALRGNTYLERLDLGCLYVRDGCFQSIVSALPENRGMTHLGLNGCSVDDRCWDNLVGAIAKHPSLLTLSFKDINDDDEDANENENESWFLKRHDPMMHSLAGMLTENEQVDDIQVDNSFDPDVWDAVVAPRLEINLYRKRFRAIQAIGLEKTRAAIVARALARIALSDVKSESSLIFMVLSQNCDVCCSFLDGILTRDNHISVPSRNRSRLPSEDVTCPL
jgi:hypothetical protein